MEPSLRAGNGSFAAGLLDPDIAAPGNVIDMDRDAAPKRYGVYRNNVVVGLMEAMRSAFPSVREIMGDASFDRVARNFIAMHPPRSAMMQAYGQEFGDFIDIFPPMREARYLADVARLERLFLDAFHAADADPLAAGDLAGLDSEESLALTFAPHPALGAIASRWPVASLFAFRDGRPENAIDLGSAEAVMVTRPAFDVFVTTLDAGAFALLELLASGEPLGSAAGAVLEKHPETDIAASLALFLQAGAFRRQTLPE